MERIPYNTKPLMSVANTNQLFEYEVTETFKYSTRSKVVILCSLTHVYI